MAQIQGRYALTYEGVNAPTPPNFIFETRAPTSSDYIGIDIGTIWLNQIKTAGNPPVYSTSLPYMLVAKAQSFGTWVPLGGGGGGATPVINTVYFNTPGTFTYTPTIGISQVSVECLGGGGPGYNSIVQGETSPYHHNAGDPITIPLATPSGAAGGYCKRTFTAAQIGASQTVVVGAGGVATTFATDSQIGFQIYTWNQATPGGDTTFGTFMTASGAEAPPFYNTSYVNALGAAGGAATGGDINVPGQNSPSVAASTVSSVLGGANSMYGSGGIGLIVGTIMPLPGLGYGSGGSNYNYVTTVGTVVTTVGSNGAPGICIITEYF